MLFIEERGASRLNLKSDHASRVYFCCCCFVAASVTAAAAAAARVLIDDCIHKCSVLLCVCSCLSALFHNSACCRWPFSHSECMVSVFQVVFVIA